VPPLATAGIFMAHAQWPQAQGAFLLAFVNMVAIQVGASIALRACGYGANAGRGPATLAASLRRQGVSLLLMIALVATLGLHGVRLFAQQRYEARVRETLKAALSNQPEARLNEVSFANLDGRAVVTAVVRSPERFTRAEVGSLSRRLPLAPDGSVPQLRLRHVEVEIEAGGD